MQSLASDLWRRAAAANVQSVEDQCAPPLSPIPQFARIPRRPLEVKEGGATRRITRGPDRGGRHEIDICVGRTGTHRGSTDTQPTDTPNSMLLPGSTRVSGRASALLGCGRAQPGHPPAAALRRPHLLTTGVGWGERAQNAVRTLETQQTAMLQSSRKEADSQAAIATAIAAKQTSIAELAAAERCADVAGKTPRRQNTASALSRVCCRTSYSTRRCDCGLWLRALSPPHAQ